MGTMNGIRHPPVTSATIWNEREEMCVGGGDDFKSFLVTFHFKSK